VWEVILRTLQSVELLASSKGKETKAVIWVLAERHVPRRPAVAAEHIAWPVAAAGENAVVAAAGFQFDNVESQREGNHERRSSY
jgi:hypothetical protein